MKQQEIIKKNTAKKNKKKTRKAFNIEFGNGEEIYMNNVVRDTD